MPGSSVTFRHIHCAIIYMKRVLIVGSGGSGKSTFARQLGAILQTEVIHLDALYWKAGWKEPSKPDWAATVDTVLRKDSWIMDGNYSGTVAPRIAACDTVIFLDLPRLTCMLRVLKRSLRYRNTVRPDMAAGCPERIDLAFLKWIWQYPKRSRPAILGHLANQDAERGAFRLRTPTQVEQFLNLLQLAITHRKETEKMRLRPAFQTDAPAISQIHVSAWRAAYAGIVPDAYLNGLTVTKRNTYWSNAIAQGEPEVVVAEDKAGINGWIAFGASRDDDAKELAGEIAAIYIAADSWSQGIGQRLLRHACARLAERGYSTVTLWVLEDNPGAIRFYRAAGLLPDGASKEADMAGKSLREVRYAMPIDSFIS
jgi:adenylate kinase family enzyme